MRIEVALPAALASRKARMATADEGQFALSQRQRTGDNGRMPARPNRENPELQAQLWGPHAPSLNLSIASRRRRLGAGFAAYLLMFAGWVTSFDAYPNASMALMALWLLSLVWLSTEVSLWANVTGRTGWVWGLGALLLGPLGASVIAIVAWVDLEKRLRAS